MVIDKKPQENTPLPVGEKTEQKMQNWTHPRCGTVLSAPVEGAKNTTCPVCDMYVTIQCLLSDYQTEISQSKKIQTCSLG